MARFSVDGLDRLILDLEDMAKIPDKVFDEMLLSGGEVIRKAESQTAAEMLQGPYYKGAVAASVTLGKPRKLKNGRCVYVTFNGTQHGNRVAEIAFVNEFGKKSQPARPFIKTAVESKAEEAEEAEAKVYDAWLRSKNF